MTDLPPQYCAWYKKEDKVFEHTINVVPIPDAPNLISGVGLEKKIKITEQAAR